VLLLRLKPNSSRHSVDSSHGIELAAQRVQTNCATSSLFDAMNFLTQIHCQIQFLFLFFFFGSNSSPWAPTIWIFQKAATDWGICSSMIITPFFLLLQQKPETIVAAHAWCVAPPHSEEGRFGLEHRKSWRVGHPSVDGASCQQPWAGLGGTSRGGASSHLAPR